LRLEAGWPSLETLACSGANYIRIPDFLAIELDSNIVQLPVRRGFRTIHAAVTFRS
jgi:hypothetical protein